MADNITNTELAQRLSALVDRWNTRENQMVAFISQPEGTVTVTDGLGQNHVLPSFPQLQKDVAALVDELTGVEVAAQGYANEARQYRDSAQGYANAAQTSAEVADTHVTEAEAARDAASASVTQAQGHASNAATSATNASASASAAAASKSAAETSATTAGQRANDALASAGAAQSAQSSAASAKIAAESARDKAAQWAAAPVGTPVENGEYSAKHWAAQAQTTVTGTLVYKGTWDAGTGAYPSNPATGHFYKVTVAGTVNAITYNVGDQIIYNGSAWDLVDNTDQVASVAGKRGAVTLVAADIGGLGALATRSDVDYTTQITGKPSSFTPSAHGHAWGDLSGVPAQATRWPTWSEVTSKPTTFAPAAHTHAIADVTNLQTELDTRPKQIATANDISTRVESGFYESSAPGGGYPAGASGWWNVLSVTHSNAANYYALQFAAAFGASEFYFRHTGGAGTKAWAKVWNASNFDPATKLDLTGGSISGALSFGSVTRQMLNLYATSYAIGVQSATMYFRTGGGFAWYFGGAHDGAQNNPGSGGTALATLGTDGLFTATNIATGRVNATGGLDTIGAGTTGLQLRWNASGNNRNDYYNNFGTGSGGHAFFVRSVTGDTPVLALLMLPDGSVQQKNANSTTMTRQPRVFVQSADPGAAAADGDLWIW